MKSFHFAAIISISTLISGCRNNMGNEVLKEKKINRSSPATTYFLNVNQDVINKPIVKLSLSKETIYNVVETEELVTKSMYTPYRGLYELYEFPSGLLILPAAIVVNVIDFALLGLLPNRFTDDLLDQSFAGLNPCLNWESEDRTISETLTSESKIVDTREEVVKRAAAGEKVTIEGEVMSVDSIKTDKKGVARLYLHDASLKVAENIEKLRKLKVYIKKGEPEETSVELIIDRNLRMRMIAVRDLIAAYNVNKSGKRLAALLLNIEINKFPRLALKFESQELKAFEDNKEFVKEFNKEMIALSTTKS